MILSLLHNVCLKIRFIGFFCLFNIIISLTSLTLFLMDFFFFLVQVLVKAKYTDSTTNTKMRINNSHITIVSENLNLTFKSKFQYTDNFFSQLNHLYLWKSDIPSWVRRKIRFSTFTGTIYFIMKFSLSYNS